MDLKYVDLRQYGFESIQKGEDGDYCVFTYPNTRLLVSRVDDRFSFRTNTYDDSLVLHAYMVRLVTYDDLLFICRNVRDISTELFLADCPFIKKNDCL